MIPALASCEGVKLIGVHSEVLHASDQDFRVPLTSFTVQCNECNQVIPGSHWHCNTCDDGDFDLCLNCVENGIHCGVDAHFLIKRSIENGKVCYSTSTIAPKKPAQLQTKEEVTVNSIKPEVEEVVPQEQTRTCNCCVKCKFLEKIAYVSC
jgi:next to BRCA1 gene 1 protein